MSRFEFWLDIRCDGESACTVFGEIDLPVRPQLGERISFHQAKGCSYEFQRVLEGVGPVRENIVSVEVDEISHYGASSEHGATFKCAIRARELNVATMEDARIVRNFLVTQSGMEVDPYAVDKLGESPRNET